MSKTLKLIIQFIVLILLLAAVGVYFYFEKKPLTEEELLAPAVEFKVLKQGLSDEVVNIWARDFKEAYDAAGNDFQTFNMSAWLTLGHILRQVGNYADAIKCYDYVSLLRPENSPSFYNLAVIYASPEYQDFKKAEENFKIAIEHQPNDLDYIQALYELYLFKYQEKKDLAADVLIQGIENNQSDKKAIERLSALLAEYYEAQGEIEKAREYYQKVLEINPENEGARRAVERLK